LKKKNATFGEKNLLLRKNERSQSESGPDRRSKTNILLRRRRPKRQHPGTGETDRVPGKTA
jgi:hypothetical protein